MSLLAPGCAVYEDQLIPPLGGTLSEAGVRPSSGSPSESAAGKSSSSSGSPASGADAGAENGGTAGAVTAGGASSASGAGAGGRSGSGGVSGGSSGTSGRGGISGGRGGAGGAAGTASAGAAGMASMGSSCADHALPSKSSWHATASSYFIGNTSELPDLCIDGDVATRWSSGVAQSAKDWIQLDLGKTATLDQVTLVLGSSTTDFPIAFDARVSDNADDFGAPVLAHGAGAAATDTVITFPNKATGRYVLISQTGQGASWWSIAEVNLACGP